MEGLTFLDDLPLGTHPVPEDAVCQFGHHYRWESQERPLSVYERCPYRVAEDLAPKKPKTKHLQLEDDE